MQYLQPYNTLSTLGYITTLAMAYIPSDQVNALSLALLNPASALYNNPNPTIKTLMSMLDPSIPLLAGATLGDGTPVNTVQNPKTSVNGAGVAGTVGNDTSSTSGVKASSVGIGLGVVGGAAIYGVAMFMVAKRYKKRKAAHRRVASVNPAGAPSMGENSTLMAAGARNSYGIRQPADPSTTHHEHGRDSRGSEQSGQSGRTFISPPVTAANSLGWN